MSIDKELAELIKKNLPEATGGALRERLEALERTEGLYKESLRTIECHKKRIDDLEKDVLTGQELVQIKERLDKQECALRDNYRGIIMNVNIISDGTPEGTHVYDTDTGDEVENVKEITFNAMARKVSAEITLLVDVKKFETTSWEYTKSR
jgi:hypothetical protein